MPQESQKQTDVVEFWRLVELFTPQTLPKNTRGDAKDIVIEWNSKEPPPWQSLPPTGSTLVWQHTVYLGLYELSEVYESLHRAFKDARDAYELRPAGRSACAGVVVDQDGCLVSGSAVLSSCAWAFGRIKRSPRRHDLMLDEFEVAKADLGKRIQAAEDRRSKAAGTESAVSLGTRSLAELLQTAVSLTGLDRVPELTCSEVMIRSRQVSQKVASELSDFDFMNSFHLDDLKLARDAVRHGEIGAGLSQYLTPAGEIDKTQRVDVLQHPEAVTAGASAARIPLGRWPSNPEHPLALSQQFAVNEAIHGTTPEGGLLGVNGPPGTGTSSLLRDLVAHNVVERARRLASLKSPEDAFEGREQDVTWTTPTSFPRRVPRLKPEIAGFEMIVASANNAAVENLTAEIPAAEAIDDRWRGRVDHFTGLASRILGDRARASAGTKPGETHDSGDTHESGEAWALLLATLGNWANRNDFLHSFWWAKPTGPEPVGSAGLEQLLKYPDPQARPWSEAVASFNSCLLEVQRMRDDRVAAELRLGRLPERRGQASTARAELGELAAALEGLNEAAAEQGRVQRAAEAERDRLAEDAALQLAGKPGWWEMLTSFGRAGREWRPGFTASQESLEQGESRADEARRAGEALGVEQSEATDRLRAGQGHLAELDAEVVQLEEQVGHDAARYGAAYPGAAWTGDARELVAPWQDPEFNIARSELFIAALRLHRGFVYDQAVRIRQGLFGAHDAILGVEPRALSAEERLAAWRLFFLVVPVVSTTFASISRMFGELRADSFGWLFVDEAGQCVPQHAVGAIWRARRTIAVGDPIQLEPVVTVPSKVTADIAASFHVGLEWIPPRVSVQTLADRVGHFGTVLGSRGEPQWVSAPLRVHRRCDNPMFDVCNRIGYEGVLVNAVQRGQDPADLFLRKTESGQLIIGPSAWLDTPADNAQGALQPAQIERLVAEIEAIHACGVPYTEMFAVTPFRPVAHALEEIARDRPGMRGGTVHAAQGRQADVVFLVLGGASRNRGAREWAASSPNLLNVAVSRARRRLYVIGSLDDWSELPHFAVLAEALAKQK